jgi:hypothetical protein
MVAHDALAALPCGLIRRRGRRRSSVLRRWRRGVQLQAAYGLRAASERKLGLRRRLAEVIHFAAESRMAG